MAVGQQKVPKMEPWQIEAWAKTCRPISGLILTHTHVCVLPCEVLGVAGTRQQLLLGHQLLEPSMALRCLSDWEDRSVWVFSCCFLLFLFFLFGLYVSGLLERSADSALLGVGPQRRQRGGFRRRGAQTKCNTLKAHCQQTQVHPLLHTHLCKQESFTVFPASENS